MGGKILYVFLLAGVEQGIHLALIVEAAQRHVTVQQRVPLAIGVGAVQNVQRMGLLATVGGLVGAWMQREKRLVEILINMGSKKMIVSNFV